MKLLLQEAKSSPADHQTVQETAPTESCLGAHIYHFPSTFINCLYCALHRLTYIFIMSTMP
jgi:hypothetical protein